MNTTECMTAFDYLQAETMAPASWPRVLIVEDDTTQEPIWDYIIEKASGRARLSWATSAVEADALISEAAKSGEDFDLVISDIFLSGALTGIDLWQSQHNHLRGNFLLVSSIDPVKLHKHVRGMGSPTYIQKPLKIPETIETVYGLLHRNE